MSENKWIECKDKLPVGTGEYEVSGEKGDSIIARFCQVRKTFAATVKVVKWRPVTEKAKEAIRKKAVDKKTAAKKEADKPESAE